MNQWDYMRENVNGHYPEYVKQGSMNILCSCMIISCMMAAILDFMCNQYFNNCEGLCFFSFCYMNVKIKRVKLCKHIDLGGQICSRSRTHRSAKNPKIETWLFSKLSSSEAFHNVDWLLTTWPCKWPQH